MFNSIKSFFAKITHAPGAIHFEGNDHRLAVAALLVHAMAADGMIQPSERLILKRLLKAQYNLDNDALDELIREGEEADSASVDFYAFTSILKRELDREGREKIVEMLWKVVLADGVVHELEDNVVWRVAELLGVETRERVMLRQRVEAELAKTG